jgi:hypothetical protein
MPTLGTPANQVRFEDKPVLSLRFWCVLFANCRAKADLFYASEHVGGNIRTSRVVAKVLSNLFFAAVRTRDARLNRYVRHGEPAAGELYYLMVNALTARYSWGPRRGSTLVSIFVGRELFTKFPSRSQRRC